MATWQQIQAAARRQLLASPGFTALVGTDVGNDQMFGQKYPQQVYTDGWVFQGIDDDNRPQRDPQDTGTSAVTLQVRSGWAQLNNYNTTRFPRLRVDIMSDQTRQFGDSGMIAKRDAVDRCSRVAAAVIAVFHDAGNQNHWWGDPVSFPPSGVYISASVLGSELNIRDVPKYDGVVMGTLIFNLTTD